MLIYSIEKEGVYVKKYYKAKLYRLLDYYDTEEILSDRILEFRYTDEPSSYIRNYMDDYVPVMDIIFEPTINPYYVKERTTGLVVPVLSIEETEEFLSNDINSRMRLLRSYKSRTFNGAPVPIFIIKRKVVHKYPFGGSITDRFYPEEVADGKTLAEYDHVHQDKKAFLYKLLDILTKGEKDMKKAIKTRKKNKPTMPLIYSGF